MYRGLSGPILPANKPPFTRNNDYANSHHGQTGLQGPVYLVFQDSGDISPYCLVTKGSEKINGLV